jgi:glutathione S-transferase
MEKITVSAFRWVPPFAQGLVRDLRVRWALEEAGLSYEQHLVDVTDPKREAYRKMQPFGQVPAMQADGVTMFESGAIVLTIAERSDALMPSDAAARTYVREWLFAALNTIEPPISMLNFIDFFAKDVADDVKKLREGVLNRISTRLDELGTVLGDRAYLVADRFTAADLMMIAVLRALRTTDQVTRRPKLAAYVRRGEERPAFQRALAAQMKNFAENAPPPPPA